MRFLISALLIGLSAPLFAEERYVAPDGCEAVVTVRHESCIVRHVSLCGERAMAEIFFEGSLVYRTDYDHPALAIRFSTPAGGILIEHHYGDGVPLAGERLQDGAVFAYSRSVRRSSGQSEAGDEGVETLHVGARRQIEIGGRPLAVREISFEVRNLETGYHYRERALLMAESEVTLGTIGVSFDGNGDVASATNMWPVSVSLPGDPGFGSFAPASSCGPSV